MYRYSPPFLGGGVSWNFTVLDLCIYLPPVYLRPTLPSTRTLTQHLKWGQSITTFSNRAGGLVNSFVTIFLTKSTKEQILTGVNYHSSIESVELWVSTLGENQPPTLLYCDLAALYYSLFEYLDNCWISVENNCKSPNFNKLWNEWLSKTFECCPYSFVKAFFILVRSRKKTIWLKWPTTPHKYLKQTVCDPP